MRIRPDETTRTLDSEAAIRQFMPLVEQIAARYSRATATAREDLVQIGAVGLLKAAASFDPTKGDGQQFRAYAAAFIRGEIRHFLRDHGSLIQPPRSVFDRSTRLAAVEECLRTELGRTPTLDEVSLASGFSVDQILDAARARDVCSFYDSLDAQSQSGFSEDAPRQNLYELVPDRAQIDAADGAERREVIMQALRNLGEKTRQVIEFVYFYDLTQKETAQMLGLSEMKVSRTVRKALRKLKEILLTEIF